MPKLETANADALHQISQLKRRAHPLVICDVDEVLLQFIPHLERFMSEQGIVFKEVAYRLKANMINVQTGEHLSDDACMRIIHAFFASEGGKQEPVPHAAKQLKRLSQHCDIVILTNLPGAENKTIRENLLKSLNIDYPLVTNDGPKGGAVAALCAERGHHPIFFIDDSPTNILSVGKSTPHVHLVHFIADPRFFKTSSDLPNVALKSNCWEETGDFIENLLRSAVS
ncbi:hypothetical protein [Pseudovibrio sp. Tun.PSC04-5.I4]|uniref:hypothetical protein n=1 Tax=Pseudovibrio sp. Tun.PSC04-5.I4 TaxID=1798213 RepID=UPI000880FCF7|nr:hypothetical protein [Pseudovibrio sp. Tun.PSC04-5.I4]SDR39359.1 hypothetical protein SAMN04515695_5292 [Pseudovibrio sp. Tun.PSC04-5.I4]